MHELGAERAILQCQTMHRFKRTLLPRPTSRAAHDRQTKCMLSAPRAKIAKILREIQALATQILRECDAKRTTFSTPNTPPTRSSTTPTSYRCRSDAVRSLGALNIKNATDSQVVCNRSANFRTEIFARTRRRARDFATPNAAPIQARALPTSDVSCSARSPKKLHVERQVVVWSGLE